MCVGCRFEISFCAGADCCKTSRREGICARGVISILYNFSFFPSNPSNNIV